MWLVALSSVHLFIRKMQVRIPKWMHGCVRLVGTSLHSLSVSVPKDIDGGELAQW